MTSSRLASPVGEGGTTIADGCVPLWRNLIDSYTITIAPNDDSGAVTRLVVDSSGDQVRITDVHLHAPQGLSSGHIPTVDFDLLLQAVTGTVTASNGQSVAGAAALSAPRGTPALEAATATEPAEESAAPATPKGRKRKATPRDAATPCHGRVPPRQRPMTKPPRLGDRHEPALRQRHAPSSRPPAKASEKTATAKTPPASPSKRTATRAAAPTKSQARTKRARTATTTAAPATSGRVYRRTPDDLAAVFEQVATVAGIAAHYQVPRHTAQGWVSRLRATT